MGSFNPDSHHQSITIIVKTDVVTKQSFFVVVYFNKQCSERVVKRPWSRVVAYKTSMKNNTVQCWEFKIVLSEDVNVHHSFRSIYLQ